MSETLLINTAQLFYAVTCEILVSRGNSNTETTRSTLAASEAYRTPTPPQHHQFLLKFDKNKTSLWTMRSSHICAKY